MSDLPACPKCQSALTYEDGSTLVCPECAHEWTPGAPAAAAPSAAEPGLVVRDAFGAVLADGDTVTVIKDLKVKGAASSLKVGTKVRNIRLVDGDHGIDCRIDGFGAMALKSEFVKKA
jgi:protein PhnA